ncbi:hypothetical protein DFH09DRAFT_1073177 [Mycena vulgaris]|nr:hypothetical protein DFH09DRAFT_1073177 [Mycena vulgaris]
MADVDDKFMYDARHGRCYGLEDAIGAAHHLKLDTLARPQARDVRKWALLVDECLKAFPALNDFAGRWPVEFYYTQYTYWRGMKQRRKQKGERGAEAGARAVSGLKAPRTDSTPNDSPTSGTRELNSKKRKEHPDPGRGEKENVSVDDSVWSTNRTQTPAASHNRIAPKWALTQPVGRRDGEGTSSTARREDDGCPTSQLCPLPSWAVKSVSSNQIAGNTTEAASLPPVAFKHAEISSTAPREDAIARNTAAPLAPSGRGERSSTAGREAEGSSNMFTPTQPQTKPQERRHNPTTRRESNIPATGKFAGGRRWPPPAIGDRCCAGRRDRYVLATLVKFNAVCATAGLIGEGSTLVKIICEKPVGHTGSHRIMPVLRATSNRSSHSNALPMRRSPKKFEQPDFPGNYPEEG